MSGEIEVDESYFGARRVRGKRGRGAGRKTPVFGMLKRQASVYTQVVKHFSAKELLPIIKDFSELEESEIYSDGLKSYGALVDFLLRFVLQLRSRRSKGTLPSKTL